MIKTPRKAHGIKFHAFYQNYLIIIKVYACMCNHILPVSTSLLTTLMNYKRGCSSPLGEEYVFELYLQLNSVYMQTKLSDHGRWKNNSTRTDFRNLETMRAPERIKEERELIKTTWIELPGERKSWFQSLKHASWQHTPTRCSGHNPPRCSHPHTVATYPQMQQQQQQND